MFTFVVPNLDSNLSHYDEKLGYNVATERMWVSIKEVVDDYYIGILDNQPFVANEHITLGTEITFGPQHVINKFDVNAMNDQELTSIIQKAISKGNRESACAKCNGTDIENSNKCNCLTN
jgi:hypothetical protein